MRRIHLNSTDVLSGKCVIKKNFLIFHLNSMKIGEVVVIYDVYYGRVNLAWLKFVASNVLDTTGKNIFQTYCIRKPYFLSCPSG